MATSAGKWKQTRQGLLPSCAPMQLVVGVIFLAIIQVILATQWKLEQPFFGLSLQWQGDRIVLHAHEGAKNTAVPVDRISTPTAGLTLPAQTLAPNPDMFVSFGSVNSFYLHQDALFHLLNKSDTITLHGETQQFPYAKTDMRLSDITPPFWLMQLFGTLAVVIGTAFWAFHRHQAVTRILVIASLGLALMQWTAAQFSTRELALSASIFSHLVALNHLGGLVFAGSAISLLLFHPAKLAGGKTVTAITALLVFFWVNEQMQWAELPIGSYYFPMLLALVVFIVLAGCQLQVCWQQPAQKQQLQWLTATLLMGLTVAFFLDATPMLLKSRSWLSLTAMNAIGLLMFLSFVLGVQRGDLFTIHRWWMRPWIIYAAAAVLIVMDVSALLSLNKHAPWGLGLLTITLAWPYLPVHRKIWHQYVIGKDAALAVPPRFKKDEPLLQPLLQQLKPLHFTCTTDCPDVNDTQHGMALILAVGDGKRFWIFVGKMRGFGLFSLDDASSAYEHLSANYSDMGDEWPSTTALDEDNDRSTVDEQYTLPSHIRQTSNLLDMLHESEHNAAYGAMSAPEAARLALIEMAQPELPRPLKDYCALWKEDILRRCLILHCNADWQEQDEINSITIDPVQAHNLQRILREAVTNALRHARPSQIHVVIGFDLTHLNLHVIDNGAHRPLEEWRCGKGLRSLQQRAQEMQGQAQWRLSRNHRECHFNARIPLHQFAPTTPTVLLRKPARGVRAQHVAA